MYGITLLRRTAGFILSYLGDVCFLISISIEGALIFYGLVQHFINEMGFCGKNLVLNLEILTQVFLGDVLMVMY